MNRWIGRVFVSLLALLTTTAFAGTVFFRIVGPADTAFTGIDQDGTILWTNSTVGVTVTVQRATALLGDGDWRDYVQQLVDASSMAAKVADFNIPEGMVFIPGGQNAGTDPDFGVYSLTVESFYMDAAHVTKAQWDDVYTWAVTNGYSFDNAGLGKATNHPVHTVNWYDTVKWCNARSEMEGHVPAYYTTNVFTSAYIYRTGRVDLEDSYVKLDSGYRLPTDMQWEFAARGGLRGQRFPWGDTISHSNANYYSYWIGGVPYYAYDDAITEGYHPTYNVGILPYTSPVGSFVANGYGLRDMGGNMGQWVFDWHPLYAGERSLRGGGWLSSADLCRVGHRENSFPHQAVDAFGFRAVLPLGQP